MQKCPSISPLAIREVLEDTADICLFATRSLLSEVTVFCCKQKTKPSPAGDNHYWLYLNHNRGYENQIHPTIFLSLLSSDQPGLLTSLTFTQ